MDIVYYWDTQIQNVWVRYLGSEFLGHITNDDLLNKIEERTSMFNMKNLELLMNCPNVNWKLFECFISKRESKEHFGLINIGNCNLHVLSTLSKQEQMQLVRICIGWWIHVSKYYTTHQEEEKIISLSLMQMFSHFIYEQLRNFNYF